MNCKFCHAQIEEDAKVCPVCGEDLTADEAVPQEVENEAAEETAVVETAERQEPAKKLSTRVIAIVCSVVLLLGLGAGIWYGLNGGFVLKSVFGQDDVFVKSGYTVAAAEAEKSADVVIARVGDKTLSNRQLQVYYWMSVLSFVQENAYYLSSFGLDVTQPLSEQMLPTGDMTWEQYFIEGALNNWHYYQSLQIEAEKNGYTLPEDLRTEMESLRSILDESAQSYGFASADEMLQEDIGLTANAQMYLDYVELYYGGVDYFASLYEKIDPSPEEVEAYYNANGDLVEETYGVNKETGRLIDVRHILVMVDATGTDENGNDISTEEDWANCLADAQKILDTWKEGAATEESFALLANNFSEDPGSNTTGGLYSYVYQGQMVKDFNDWCFDEARRSGDTGIVQSSYGYHVMYFSYGDEGWIRRSRQMLIEDTCTEMLAEVMKQTPLMVNYKDIVLCEFSIY